MLDSSFISQKFYILIYNFNLSLEEIPNSSNLKVPSQLQPVAGDLTS